MPDTNLFTQRNTIRDRMAQDKILLKEINDHLLFLAIHTQHVH